MTRLALGAKCGVPKGSPNGLPSPAKSLGLSKDVSATAPMPRLVRPSNCRRERRRAVSVTSFISSLRDRLVQVQDHTRDRRVGGDLRGVEFLVAWGFTRSQQLLRRLRFRLVMRETPLKCLTHHFRLRDVRRPGGRQLKREGNSLINRCPAFAHHPL